MKQDQAVQIVIDVALKRRPQSRTSLEEAVRVLESPAPAPSPKKKASK